MFHLPPATLVFEVALFSGRFFLSSASDVDRNWILRVRLFFLFIFYIFYLDLNDSRIAMLTLQLPATWSNKFAAGD